MNYIKNILKTGVLLLLLTLVLTGCGKETIEMEIKKDKSMTVTITAAYSNEFSAYLSEYNSGELITDEEKEKYQKLDITVEDFKDDNYTGIKLIKRVKNIDEISTSQEANPNLGQLFQENAQKQYYFMVKKGFFKNHYRASFVIKDLTDEADLSADEVDLDQLVGNNKPEVYFSIKLPEKAISSNATNVSEDGLELKWDLLDKSGPNTIDVEFFIYNRNHVIAMYAVIGALILIFISTFIDLSRKNAKKEKIKVYNTSNVKPKDLGEVDETETSMNNQMNTNMSI